MVTAGSSGANLGTLSLSIGGNLQASVAPAAGGSSSPHFTVPPDHMGYVYDWRVSAAMSQISYGGVQFMARPSGEMFYPLDEILITAGAAMARSGPLALLDAGTDMSVRAWQSGSGNAPWMASSYRIAIMPAAT